MLLTTFVGCGHLLAQVQTEFSDNFPRLEIRGGSKCQQASRQVCLPKNCRIDFSRTLSTSTTESGGYGQGGAGYGVSISSINNHRPAGFATYVLNTQSQCLTSTVKVCAKNQQRGWYEGHHIIYARCYPKCDCGSGAWFDVNRDSCVTGACGTVPGMPDGDKGGGYFAWQNNLFKNVPCTPCQLLNRTMETTGNGWKVKTPSGVEVAASVVASPNSGWATGSGQWISADPASGLGSSPGGDYTYTTSFCLCAGYEQASLQLTVWGDNKINSVSLNGNLIAGPTTGVSAFTGPGLNATTNTYSHFVPGQNELRVVINNSGVSPTGLRISGVLIAPAGQCP